MFACGKMPKRTFADGRFTGIVFVESEDCLFIFPVDTEMSVRSIVGLVRTWNWEREDTRGREGDVFCASKYYILAQVSHP